MRNDVIERHSKPITSALLFSAALLATPACASVLQEGFTAEFNFTSLPETANTVWIDGAFIRLVTTSPLAYMAADLFEDIDADAGSPLASFGGLTMRSNGDISATGIITGYLPGNWLDGNGSLGVTSLRGDIDYSLFQVGYVLQGVAHFTTLVDDEDIGVPEPSTLGLIGLGLLGLGAMRRRHSRGKRA